MNYQEVMDHDHEVYWCSGCREAFAPSQVADTTGINDDGSTRCPSCNAIMYAEPHFGVCELLEAEQE